MIEFLQKDPKLSHSQSIVITYPRTVQITFGNYPYVEDVHNFIIEVKKNISPSESYATNVKGGMTDWKYFCNHPLTTKFINYCINQHQVSNPHLFSTFYDRMDIEDAWGNEIKKGDYVVNHVHKVYHGILYLTEGSPLILPELNIQITPKPGDYYFFPPQINHYVNPSENENNRYNIIFNITEKSQRAKWDRDKRIFEKSKEVASKK